MNTTKLQLQLLEAKVFNQPNDSQNLKEVISEARRYYQWAMNLLSTYKEDPNMFDAAEEDKLIKILDQVSSRIQKLQQQALQFVTPSTCQ